jgi:hypothetical protein
LQPGVCLDPVQVGVQYLDKLLELRVELSVDIEENPVSLGRGIRNRLAIMGGSAQQRNDLLASGLSFGEFLGARAGI